MKQKIRGLVWNVAGLWRKEEDFWEFLKDYEVIGLTETWVDEAESYMKSCQGDGSGSVNMRRERVRKVERGEEL